MPKGVRARVHGIFTPMPSHAMQSIRTTRGAKRVYAALCNAGYEIFFKRGV